MPHAFQPPSFPHGVPPPRCSHCVVTRVLFVRQDSGVVPRIPLILCMIIALCLPPNFPYLYSQMFFINEDFKRKVLIPGFTVRKPEPKSTYKY